MSYNPYIPQNLDAVSRLRISNAQSLFDAQFTYDLQPLIFEQLISGSGSTITHDTTNRCASLEFSGTPTGNTSIMQSYEYLRHYPGMSSQVFITFNMVTKDSNSIKFAGYSDGSNGFEFRVNGSNTTGEELEFVILSDTGIGDQVAKQPNWNIDKLNGTGKSGLILDITKTQILVIDFQALYAGKVRFGFIIDGQIIYAHEFLNSNILTLPYIQTVNLPVRVGMTTIGTSTTTMRFICSSVLTENGGQEQTGFGMSFSNKVIAANGTQTHLMSLRPRTTFNSFPNRAKVGQFQLDIIVTGNTSVQWELCLGQSISGSTTYTNVNTNYSVMEYNTSGTLSGSPDIIIDRGFIPSTNNSKTRSFYTINSKYPITLDASGNPRALGTLTLVVKGIGAASSTYAALKWIEIR